ncbi:NAD(P)-dependent oxidoreductase [Caballeronia sp. NK8]|uniref:NAD(P)-dependent oxidoreductase n=1 Tax=Caballeronia sp. NK8 TaxID=140098 RepID=UPI0026575933|nr:NAD(P)-dependent oxidoreductase [Caballeronia sp. NK8]
MAGNLLEKGFDVRGFDTGEAARERFASRGGHATASFESATRNVALVLTSLPTAAALYEVAGELAREAVAGRVVIEVSTLSLADKEAARAVLADAGTILLDCPVSGTGSQAASGDLTIFASGDPVAFEHARPVLHAVAREVIFVGGFGNGSKLKFIANHLVTIHNAATAEALTLARQAGLDLPVVFDALKNSAATSRMFQIRGPMVIERQYAPAMRISTYQKDLDIIGSFATHVRCPTPLFSVCAQLYLAAQGMGHGALDTAAIAIVLEALAGAKQQSNGAGSSQDSPI